VNGGSDRGVQDYPAQVGWVTYNPVSSSVFEYPTFTQTAVWTRNLNEGKNVNEEITFTNRDQMLIAADINLSYHLESTKVPAFYVKFRSDDLDHFTHGFLRNLARDIFNEHAGRYEIAQIMGDNATFLAEVRQSLQEQVRDIGVTIDQFGIIGAPRPPQAVIDAINAKVHATQLAIQKQNELVQVQADMAKEREKTDTYARNTLTLAEAQAKSNRLLNDSLTGNLIELKRLEKWNGILPQVSGGATPFINLTK
jgi:NAD kinase